MVTSVPWQLASSQRKMQRYRDRGGARALSGVDCPRRRSLSRSDAAGLDRSAVRGGGRRGRARRALRGPARGPCGVRPARAARASGWSCSVTEDRGGSFCRGDAVSRADRLTRSGRSRHVRSPAGRLRRLRLAARVARSQRALKAAVVAEQLRRLASAHRRCRRSRSCPAAPLDWRTRVRLAVDCTGRPGFRAHRSHRVIPVADCPIAAPGTVDEVVGRPGRPALELAVAVDANAVTHVVDVGRARLSWPRWRSERAAHRDVAGVAADGFWQVHPDAADVYAEVVSSWSGAASPASRRGTCTAGWACSRRCWPRRSGRRGR